MLSPINFFTCIILIWHADASVIIYQTGADVGNDCFECGEQLVLSCQIDSYSISMSWQNDSSNVPFAQCVFDSCTLDPDVANNFVFSTNTSTGIFNLTFIVSNYNNGTTYMCTDGSMSYSSLVLTKDYRPTFNNTIPGQLIAMSGCVNKDVSVGFTWKQQDGNDYTPTYVDDNPSRDELLCMLDTECGAADSVKYIRTIKVDRGGAGDQRLKVIVSYNNVPVDSFLTEETYIVNVAGICVWDISDYIYLVFMVLFLLIDIILVGVFSYCIFVNWTKKNDWEFSCWVYILTVLSCIPLFVTGVMTFLKFDSCSGELYCTCKAWIIVGYIEIVWFSLHVIFGLIVIFCTRNQCKGSNNCARNVYCVCSMFFLNFLGFVFLFCCWILHEVNKKGDGEDNSQDKHKDDLKADQERPITTSDGKGLKLPIIETSKPKTKRMTEKQHAQIHDILYEKGAVSGHQTEQTDENRAKLNENSKDGAKKGLDATKKSVNATEDKRTTTMGVKISGHQTEQNDENRAKLNENSKDGTKKGLDAKKSVNATENKRTTTMGVKLSGHQTEQNDENRAKLNENSKVGTKKGLDAKKSVNATQDKRTTTMGVKISDHQTEQNDENGAKLNENSKDGAKKGLDAKKSVNATEDERTTTMGVKISDHQTEQKDENGAKLNENSNDGTKKGLDAKKSVNATEDKRTTTMGVKISGHQTEQNDENKAKLNENSKDVAKKDLDAKKSVNATEDKRTTITGVKISGHQTEQNDENRAKLNENSKDVKKKDLDAKKSVNATEDKRTTTMGVKISGHQTEQNDETRAKLNEKSKDVAKKGLDAKKSVNATEDKRTTTMGGKISPAEIKDPIHIDVQQEGQHTQATDITNKNGTMNRSLSAVFSPDEQLKNTKR